FHVVLGNEIEPALEGVQPAAPAGRDGEPLGEVGHPRDVAGRGSMLECLLDRADLYGAAGRDPVKVTCRLGLRPLELRVEEVADGARVPVAAAALVERLGHACA